MKKTPTPISVCACMSVKTCRSNIYFIISVCMYWGKVCPDVLLSDTKMTLLLIFQTLEWWLLKITACDVTYSNQLIQGMDFRMMNLGWGLWISSLRIVSGIKTSPLHLYLTFNKMLCVCTMLRRHVHQYLVLLVCRLAEIEYPRSLRAVHPPCKHSLHDLQQS